MGYDGSPMSGSVVMRKGSRDTEGLLDGVKKVTQANAIVVFMSQSIGAGILVLPCALIESGGVGGMLLLAFGSFCMLYGCLLTGKAIDLARELYPGTSLERIESISKLAAGSGVKIFMFVLSAAYFFFVLAVFVLLMAENVERIVLQVSPSMTKVMGVDLLVACKTFFGIILIPAVWLRDVSSIAKFSNVTVVGTIVLITCMLIASGKRISNSDADPVEYDRWGNTSKYLNSYCVALFSYNTAMVVPMVKKGCAANDFKKAVWKSHIFTMVAYGIIVGACYWAWGKQNVEDKKVYVTIYKENMTTIGAILSVAVIGNILVAFPLVGNCFFVTLDSVLPQEGWAFRMARSSFVVLCVAIAIVAPIVNDIIGVLSAVASPIMCMIAPAVLYQAFMAQKYGLRPSLKMEPVRVGVHLVLCLLGLLALVFGTTHAVIAFNEAIKKRQASGEL